MILKNLYNSIVPITTFFYKGETLFNFKEQFKEFHQEVKDDPLFDFQDYSYSHIGLGCERGKPISVLKNDYEKSFAVHEEIFGERPVGISMCGTSEDGPSVNGFDSTEKSFAEIEMIAGLGVKMINTFHSCFKTNNDFMNYSRSGHPEIMGFPVDKVILHGCKEKEPGMLKHTS